MKLPINLIAWLIIIALCLFCASVVYPQMVPVPPAEVITPLPPIQFEDFWIDHWYLNGNTNNERAIAISTNWSTNAVIVFNSPRNGGTVTNFEAVANLVTNREIVFHTNDTVFYEDAPAPLNITYAYEIVGIVTSTNVSLNGPWSHVGWPCNQPQQFFMTNITGLSLQLVTFTNQ